MKHIFIFGYYGFQNTGDEAILESVITDIKELSPELEMSVLTYNAKYTNDTHKVKVISRSKIFEIISTIKKCDLLISGGGSLLQDITSSRSLIFYLGLIFIAKLFGKKVMFYGNGYGPVNKKFNKYLVKKIVSRVDVVNVRDYMAKEELNKLGIIDNVMVTADPTFTMTYSNSIEIDSIFEKEKISRERELIGISVRRWNDDGTTKQVISQAIDYMHKIGFNVLLIPMQHPNDLEFSFEIKDACKTSPYILENYYKPKNILGIIGEMTMLIGIRLHSLIFAAIKNVPMIGIEYDPKVKSFLELVEQESVGDIENIDLKSLCSSIDEVYNNIDHYKNILKNKTLHLEKKARENVTATIELLEK